MGEIKALVPLISFSLDSPRHLSYIDITDDIMTRDKLADIADLIDNYRNRASNLKTDDIIHLARLLERTRRKTGVHLMYESPLPGQRVLPITGHPSKTIGRGLALKMINHLESDLDAWKSELEAEEKKKAKGNGYGR